MGSLAARRSPPPTAGGLTVLFRGGRALAPVLSLLIFIACGDGGQTPTTSVPPSPSVSPPPVSPPPPLPPPPAPSGLRIADRGADFIEWTWSPVDGVSGYDVQFSVNEMFTDEDEIIVLNPEQTSYRRVGLGAETSAYLRVRSAAGTGDERIASDWSAHVTGITLAPPPPPLPPEIGSPCPGVMVRGEAPEHDDPVVRATLLIDWQSGSVGSFDWAGPYHDDRPDEELSSLLEVNVAEWRVEILDGVTRHALEIEWPPFLEASLQFRSGDGGCVLSVLACSATVCELRP